MLRIYISNLKKKVVLWIKERIVGVNFIIFDLGYFFCRC